MRLGFTPLNAEMVDLNEVFKLASELKLHHVELSFDMHELLPDLQNPQRVNELSRATGIGTTVHLSYVDLNLASKFPGVRENSVARSNRGLEYAQSVNAHCAVLHTGLVPLRHPIVLGLANEQLKQSLTEIKPLVPVAIENLALDGYDLLRGPSELEAVTKHAGANFGNTLDFGHALVEGCSTEFKEGVGAGGLANGEARLQSYQTGLSNILHLHLHDNDGISDQHLPVGAGSINWEAHKKFLQNFTGTITLEVPDVRASVKFLRENLGLS